MPWIAGIGRLLLDLILARGLAQLLRAGDHVEDVVDDLERQAEVGPGHAERADLLRRRAAEHRADAERGADQGARLVDVDVVDGVGADLPALRLEVGHLARRPCRRVPGRVRDVGHDRLRARRGSAARALSATSRKASVSSASPARIAMASPKTLWLVGTPRRKSSLSIAGRSSWTSE